ncbi:hypothetical protein J6590_043491 [Homalodisca vitripennis]|nr:hypothetical protein J6590_043491 [Homalodisca vitripennis]
MRTEVIGYTLSADSWSIKDTSPTHTQKQPQLKKSKHLALVLSDAMGGLLSKRGCNPSVPVIEPSSKPERKFSFINRRCSTTVEKLQNCCNTRMLYVLEDVNARRGTSLSGMEQQIYSRFNKEPKIHCSWKMTKSTHPSWLRGSGMWTVE